MTKKPQNHKQTTHYFNSAGPSTCKHVDFNIIIKFEDPHRLLMYVRYEITVRTVVRLAPQVPSILKYGTTDPDDIQAKNKLVKHFQSLYKP